MDNATNCPSCNAKIKSGVFGSNEILSDLKCELIAEINNEQKKIFCGKCSNGSYAAALEKYNRKINDLQIQLKRRFPSIPIITTHSPIKWDYTVLGMATAQTVIGTGLFSEIASSWTDLFGMQSSAYNKKISTSEELCKEQLRGKAMQMGGNAIIAVDIDYAEMGGEKGMIMVCMAGTVIKLNNLDVLDSLSSENIIKIDEIVNALKHWNHKYGSLSSS